MKTSTAPPTALTLLLALDPFGESILADLRVWGLRNPSFQIRTKGLVLHRAEEGALGWEEFSFEESQRSPTRITEVQSPLDVQAWGAQKAKAFEAFMHNQADLQRGLESALHGLRSHASFLQTGMGNHPLVNLDIFILADLTRPETTGILPPLLATVSELLAHEPYGMGHLIACTALFPEEATPTNQAALFVALRELSAQISSQEAESLRHADDKPQADFPAWCGTAYLFDYRKEGMLEAENREEINVLAANFLRGIIQYGLAQSLPGSRLAQNGAWELTGRFCSSGATLLWCDPVQLLEAEAIHLAHRIFEESLLLTGSQAACQELFKPLAAMLENGQGWGNEICEGTPFRLETGEATPMLTENLPVPNFEGFPTEKWVDTLQAWAKGIETEILPVALNQFSENCLTLCSTLRQNLAEGLNTLLNLSLKQAGTFPLLQQILKDGASVIDNQQSEIQNMGCFSSEGLQLEGLSFERHEDELKIQWQNSLDILRQLSDPTRPKERPSLRGLFRLAWREWQNPHPVRRFLTRWGQVVLDWLRGETLRRLELREQCVQIRRAYWNCLALKSLQVNLQTLYAAISTQMDAFQTDVNCFQQRWEEVEKQFAKILKTHQPETSPFRQIVLNETLIQWGSRQTFGMLAEIREQFVLTHLVWLENWRQISANELQTTWVGFGRQLVQEKGMEVSLATALAHLTEGQDTHAGAARALTEFLPVLLQGTSPLLRASFDLSGGGGEVAEGRWILTPVDLQPSIQSLLHALEIDWQVIPVDMPQALICCHSRAGFPLQGLELLRLLRRAYEKLPAAEQQALWLKVVSQQK